MPTPADDFLRWEAETRRVQGTEREMLAASEQQRLLDLQAARAPWQLNPLQIGQPPLPLVMGFLTGTVAPPQDPRSLVANRARQERIAAARDRGLSPAPADVTAEQARQGLGRALSAAVEAGYLTEEDAVAMIVAGRLADTPMSPQEGRTQLTRALDAAVESAALPSVVAAQVRVLLGYGGTPTASSPDRAAEVDELRARIERRDSLLYAALTLRPCHRSEHADLHRAAVLCSEQASELAAVLVDGLVVAVELLPRTPHTDPDGGRAACCRADGQVGTWLRWGQTTDPSMVNSAQEGP